MRRIGLPGLLRTGRRAARTVAQSFSFAALAGSLASAAPPHDVHLVYDGLNDVASAPSSAALSPTTQITVEAWINPRTLAANANQDRVVSKSGSYELTLSTGDTGCGFGTQGAVQWRLTLGGVDARICGGQIAPGSWRHIAGVYDGAAATLYVDGERVASATRSGPISASASALTLGNRPALDRAYDGALDEVRIWRRALTQAELQANDRSLSGAETGLAAYYRIDGGSGQALADATANAQHGVLGATGASESSDPQWNGGGAANAAPIADAGADQTILWPSNTVQLFGSAQDDGLPSGALTFLWRQASGPGSVTFANAAAAQTSATFSAPGVYALTLRVSDGALSHEDQVQITLSAQASSIGTLEISPHFVTLGPSETQTFTAVARDANGAIVSVRPSWSASSGAINANGAYSAASQAGLVTITASANGVTTRAHVDVKSSATLWPGGSWTVATPASMNLDATLLAQARDYALTGAGSGQIIRGGRQVMSWGAATTRYDVKSTTKSIGGSALGLALLDGAVAMSDLAQTHLPTFGVPPDANAATGWLDDITLLQLATHTAGFEKPGGYTELLFAPGSRWSYTDGGANWLADVLTNVYRTDLRTLLFSRVFTPLGIASADLTWRSNAYREDTLNGVKRREFGAGIALNANAMSRIGYLYLRRGLWQGQRLLPDAFVQQVQRPDPGVAGVPVRNAASFPAASNHYGVLWWTNADSTLPQVPRDAYWAWGLGDSLIVVIPSLDLVAVRAGNAWRGGGWTADYSVVDPFITPLARAASPKISVPRLTGLSRAAALSALNTSGLAASRITEQTSASVPAGAVITQTPAANTLVARNTGVQLVISRGP
jgi:CubicO group peptidase (beta-lactamase class C family)